MIDNAPDCYVMSPSIQGRGLFAGKNFREGDIIVDFTPYKKDFYKKKYTDLNDYQIKYNWYVQLDEENCLTFDRFSKFSYINHSRNPNCNWLVKDYIIVAAKNILINEEITVDYRVEQRPNRVEYPSWI